MSTVQVLKLKKERKKHTVRWGLNSMTIGNHSPSGDDILSLFTGSEIPVQAFFNLLGILGIKHITVRNTQRRSKWHIRCQIIRTKANSPAEKPPFMGVPSNVVYSFVLGIKWKPRMSRFRICMMPPWHPWAFCALQDGVQDGRQFKQTSRTPLLLNIVIILVSNPMFLGSRNSLKCLIRLLMD
jgi:hypothetical protein